MESQDLVQKIKKIEIKARGISKQLFAGSYQSTFKGRGMTFSEVRDYQHGDEVRTIDWNVTARFRSPYVKTFEEERELTIMLLIDVSSSDAFGTKVTTKKDFIAELSAVLAFSAIKNDDKVGVIFFSDEVETYIPPRKGRNHTLRIVRDLLEFKTQNKGTNIALALDHLNKTVKKKCTTFLISDFLDNNYSDAIRTANSKHDLICLRIFDDNEGRLPKLGMIQLKDPETQNMVWVDTFSRKTQRRYKEWWNEKKQYFMDSCKSCGVDFTALNSSENYVPILIKLFKGRGKRK